VDELFPTELKDRLEQIRDADIVVGIPSYNNARTIGHVVRAVSVGLAKYFPTQRSVIVNSDGGSKDKTQDVVMRAESGADDLGCIASGTTAMHQHLHHGVPGKAPSDNFRRRAALEGEGLRGSGFRPAQYHPG
jgi:glycosyltransferase involved in cell wall biosynthesis